jgi:predicted SnoaL-like aldol condensation-catalyzing enzyme
LRNAYIVKLYRLQENSTSFQYNETMRFALQSLVALISIQLAVAADPYCPPRPASPEQQAKIFFQFVDTFVNKNDFITALETHVADTYVQHNPAALSGREQTLGFFKNRPKGGTPLAVKNTIINQGLTNNVGFVHYKMEMPGSPRPKAIVDLFKMNGTCVMEHWDVIQERPENPKNPLAMWSRR